MPKTRPAALHLATLVCFLLTNIIFFCCLEFTTSSLLLHSSFGFVAIRQVAEHIFYGPTTVPILLSDIVKAIQFSWKTSLWGVYQTNFVP